MEGGVLFTYRSSNSGVAWSSEIWSLRKLSMCAFLARKEKKKKKKAELQRLVLVKEEMMYSCWVVGLCRQGNREK